MARPFRLWGKKRGQRHTGSQFAGGLGEALFFSVLFLLGAVSLTVLITSRVMYADAAQFTGWGMWLLVLVFASFLLIGGGGIVFTALQVGASAERRAVLVKRASDLEALLESAPELKDYPSVPDDANLTNSPGTNLAYRLPIAHSPAWRLATAAAFFLLAGGVASALLVVAVGQHMAGHPDWFLTVFLLPLLALAVWSFVYFVRQMIAHSGVGTTSLEISDHPLKPGGDYRVFLTQSGRLSVDLLELSLVCEETATFHQGTDVRTESRAVYRRNIFSSKAFEIKPGSPFEHADALHIPHDAMHSFQSGNNSVNWKLVVKGQAEGWPAYERSFPVVVYPDANGKAST